MTRRRVAVPAAVALVVLVVLAVAYLYGRSASCPPPDWWVRLFLQSGTYRCAG